MWTDCGNGQTPALLHSPPMLFLLFPKANFSQLFFFHLFCFQNSKIPKQTKENRGSFDFKELF